MSWSCTYCSRAYFACKCLPFVLHDRDYDWCGYTYLTCKNKNCMIKINLFWILAVLQAVNVHVQVVLQFSQHSFDPYMRNQFPILPHRKKIWLILVLFSLSTLFRKLAPPLVRPCASMILTQFCIFIIWRGIKTTHQISCIDDKNTQKSM